MIDEETAYFTAWIAKTSDARKEEKYDLFLYLGKVSLELYQKGLDIRACVPDTGQTDIFVHMPKKEIYLHLR